MKRNRDLWVSVVFVGVLVVASILGFAFGGLKPTLGLDLEGGLSVILSAPDGTTDTVMNQALENIRNRVDAFGVGEPQIFLSGNNIEVQLPGLAPGTIQSRSKDQWCVASSDGGSYGCAKDQATAEKALAEVTVISEPTKVCVADAQGNVLDQALCFGTQTEADTALAGLTVQPKASTTPSASPSTTPVDDSEHFAAARDRPVLPDRCLREDVRVFPDPGQGHRGAAGAHLEDHRGLLLPGGASDDPGRISIAVAFVLSFAFEGRGEGEPVAQHVTQPLAHAERLLATRLLGRLHHEPPVFVRIQERGADGALRVVRHARDPGVLRLQLGEQEPGLLPGPAGRDRPTAGHRAVAPAPGHRRDRAP